MKLLGRSAALGLLLALLLTGCGGSRPAASSAPAGTVPAEASVPAEPAEGKTVPDESAAPAESTAPEKAAAPAASSAPAEPVPEQHPLSPGAYQGERGYCYNFDQEGIVTVAKEGEDLAEGAWRTCREDGADCLYLRIPGRKEKRYTYRLTKEGEIRLTDTDSGEKDLLTPYSCGVFP